MRFKIEGKIYDYDGKVTVEDAMFIFDKSGVGLSKLNAALTTDGHPYAIAAWMYLLKRRAGEAVRWDDMLRMDVAGYEPVPDDVTDKTGTGSPQGDVPDPPSSPNGRSRRRATTATS